MNQQLKKQKQSKAVADLIQIRLPPLPKTPMQQNNKKKKRLRNRNGTQKDIYNVSQSRQTLTNHPKINGLQKSCIIENKELIQVLLFTGVFNPNITRLRVNPGSAKTFPWLNGIAVRFERFKFHYLKFHYIPRTAVTTTGSMIMAPDFDSADQGYTTEGQLYAAEGCRDTAVYNPLDLPLDPSRLNMAYKSHSTMSDTRFATTTQDTKTIDPAAVQIGGECSPDAYTGRLLVSYKVELMIPQPPTEEAFSNGSNYYWNAANIQNLATGIFTANANLQSPENLNEAQIGNLGAVIDTTKASLTANKTYPTNIIGTFLKDFNGILTTTFGGTTFVQSPNIQVNGVGSPILDAGGLNAVNGAIKNYALKAVKKGDVLSFDNALSAATLSAARLAFGGNQNFLF